MKILYGILIVLASFIICIILYFVYIIHELQPDVNVVEIRSERFNESIYIKKTAWGISADHQFFSISNSSSDKFEQDTIKDYIFYGDLFLYNFTNDTLFVYVNKESVLPKEFRSNINIKQIELTNPEMMDLWIYYDAKGLKKLK